MGIKDSIANLRKALRTTQTNAPAIIDTLIRGLDGVETAAEDQITYSTDERVVGTWIDGSEIYEKVITFESALSVSYSTYTDTTIDTTTIDKILRCDGIHENGPYVGALLADPTRESHTILGLQTTRNTANSNVKSIIIQYTKRNPSRSPENDTKNDGDEEKKNEER